MSRQPNIEIPYFYEHSRHVYSQRHELCFLDVFQPKAQSGIGQYWMIYVHGGAWRDPEIDSMSIVPALHKLSPSENDVLGVASIHYGLAPYPDHPRKPSNPGDIARNNVHPQHLADVFAALDWLQMRYSFGQRYILAGHSCGATMAFQTLTKSLGDHTLPEYHDGRHLPRLPLAVIGLEGIYDLKLLLNDHKEHSAYRQFVEGAFGTNEVLWAMASPSGWNYGALWPEGRLTILVQSDEDELVDSNQTEVMSKQLSREVNTTRQDLVIKATGKHDDTWLKGDDLAAALLKALSILRRRDLTSE